MDAQNVYFSKTIHLSKSSKMLSMKIRKEAFNDQYNPLFHTLRVISQEEVSRVWYLFTKLQE